MMRGISVKGVLLGNLAFLLFYAAVAAVVVAVTAIGIVAFGKTDADFSDVGIGVVLATPAVAALVGGYVAAQFAKERRLLNGALATAFMILFGLYGDLVGFPDIDPEHPVRIPYALDFMSTYSLPLFGMLGAHLGPLAEPRIVLRWVGAFAAAVGTHLLVLVLGVALFMWWRDLIALYVVVVSAPRFSVIAGTYAAPKHRRNEALLMSIGFAVIAPTLAALALASARHSSGWLLFALFNAIGCALAYWSMRRALERERVAALSLPFD